MLKSWTILSGALLALSPGCGVEKSDSDAIALTESALQAAGNPHGVAETVHTSGVIDRTNPFFQTLGTTARPRTSGRSSSTSIAAFR